MVWLIMIMCSFVTCNAMQTFGWKQQEESFKKKYGHLLQDIGRESDVRVPNSDVDESGNEDFENPQKKQKKERQPRVNFYPCLLCSHIFKSRTGKLIHIRAEHAKQVYECDICGKKYKHPSSLKDHKNIVHFNKKFFCPHCQEQLHDRKALWAHTKKYH